MIVRQRLLKTINMVAVCALVLFLLVLAGNTLAQGAPPLKSDKYLDDTSVVSGEPCGPPCWNNITPGKTNFTDAVTIVQGDKRFSNVQAQGKQLSWATAGGEACCQINADDKGIVSVIQLRTTPKITVKQLLDKYGNPQYTTSVDYSAQEVAIALIYPKNGLVAWITPGNGGSSVAAESPMILAVYLAPDQFDTLVKTTPLTGWAGFVPYSTFKAATPVITPPPPPTLPALPTSVAAADDLKSPCYTAEVPKVEPISNAPHQFSAPEKVTDPTHTYCAFLATERGVIVIELYMASAPQHVNSFAFLANKGYYDGLTWHRVISGFVAQTGDPKGDGTGGPGYTVPLETNNGLKYDRPGILGMARTNDPNSAGSQFFITYAPLPSLDPVPGGGYTIFGRVVKGLEVVQMIRPRDQGEPPGDKLVWVRVVDVTATK
jgi:peptidylprolyl isomerase